MIANSTQSKAAAPSTSAAAPSGSQPDAEKRSAVPAATQDADAESGDITITAADVAAALGQLSDDPKASDEPEAGSQKPEDGADEAEQSESAATDEAIEPEAETPAESEEEPAGEGDAAEDAPGAVNDPKPEEEAAPKKNAAAEARIGELTARAKTAETEAAQLREQLALLRQQSSNEATASQLLAIDTPQDLQREHQRMVRLHEWALKHEATGGKLPDGKGGEHEFTPEQVLDLKANTFRMLNVDLPQRAHYVQVKQQAEAIAVQAYPWLADTRQGDGARVQQLLEAKPLLRELTPAYRLSAADLLIGEKLRTAGIVVDDKLIARLRDEAKAKGPKPEAGSQAKPAAPVARRLPPQAPGRPGVMPARVPPRAAQSAAHHKRLSRGDGNVNDLTASIASKFG